MLEVVTTETDMFDFVKNGAVIEKVEPVVEYIESVVVAEEPKPKTADVDFVAEVVFAFHPEHYDNEIQVWSFKDLNNHTYFKEMDVHDAYDEIAGALTYSLPDVEEGVDVKGVYRCKLDVEQEYCDYSYTVIGSTLVAEPSTMELLFTI